VSLQSRLLAIWHDPVWSKLIAGAILSGLGLLQKLVLQSSVSAPSGLAVWVNRILISGASISVLFALWIWFRRRDRTKILVFLSTGSTCRDPMAKAITSKLLESRKLKHPIEIKAVGLGPIGKSEASYAARYVIKEMYNEDLLKDHKPELLTPELANEADLILAMDKSLLTSRGKTLPEGKTFLLKDFLGKSGDVTDPWPDGKDEATLSRYRRCAEDLRQLLTENLDRLVRILDL
jgi:protein-tyrosine phosphatase